GVELNLSGDPITELFAENGGYILGVAPGSVYEFESKIGGSGVEVRRVGHVLGSPELTVFGVEGQLFSMSVEEVKEAWKSEF
ncbi:hypothetical protein EBR96_04955, partial [bacterium]|nr:hypothetical protein [bacterium]